MRGHTHLGPAARRGFSLLENLIAAAVLGIVVLAVGLAVSAAQKASLEGHKLIIGAMAADDLMSELRILPYDDLPDYDGVTQPVGQIETLNGAGYPQTYWTVGRSVIVEDAQWEHPELGVKINGRRIIVSAFDDDRTIVELETFVPEPVS